MSDPKTDTRLFNETNLSLPVDRDDILKVATVIEEGESVGFEFLELVFVDEESIVGINKEHFDKDYITDTITFSYSEEAEVEHIEGTVFLCAPRIFEQALELNQGKRKEFLRVIIHSLLHLAGYQDSDASKKQNMTQKEDHYLALLEE